MSVVVIFLFVTALAFTVFAYQNFRGVKSRGRRHNVRNKRKSDKRNLSRHERRLYKESQRLLSQNKTAAAARILEQIHMHREAIQSLEDAGLIHEAAKILMRMQKHNRAGVIYARHGQWDQAANCFKMAKMPVEVGKCAREAGKHGMAAEFFEKAGRHLDAAGCFERNMDYHAAARNFLKAGDEAGAVKNYRKMIKVKENLNNVTLNSEEIDFFIRHLASGSVTPEIADYVVFKGQARTVIEKLAETGKSSVAADIFARVRGDLGLMLIGEMSLKEDSTRFYLEMFEQAGRPALKGMVFEKLQKFAEAASEFEKAKDFDRAIYCHERAGNKSKAKELKSQYSQVGRDSAGTGSGSEPASTFALAGNSHQSEANDSTEPVGAKAASQVSKSAASGKPTKIPDTDEQTQVAVLPMAERQAPPPPPQFGPNPTEANIKAQITPAKPPIKPANGPGDVESRFSLKAHDTGPKNLPRDSNAPQPEAVPVDLPTAETAGDGAPKIDERLLQNFGAAKFMEDLDQDQKKRLWQIGRTYLFNRGENILSYDVEPTGVYIVLEGSVNCFRLVSGKEQFVDRMEPGETFGELWLLAGHPTAVRFAAASHVQVHIIDREEFNELLDNDGTIARKIYKRFTIRLLQRLLTNNNKREKREAS